MQDINIEIKINLDEGETIICQKGGIQPYKYYISYLWEISYCVTDYVERYL